MMPEVKYVQPPTPLTSTMKKDGSLQELGRTSEPSSPVRGTPLKKAKIFKKVSVTETPKPV